MIDREIRSPIKSGWLRRRLVPHVAAVTTASYDNAGSKGEILGREQRKLGAIVAAEVVGYSRLIDRDERGISVRLREHRQSRLEPAPLPDGGRGERRSAR